MFCRKCGTENPDTAKFCKNCGQPLRVPAAPRRQKPSWLVVVGLLMLVVVCVVAGVGLYPYFTGERGNWVQREEPTTAVTPVVSEATPAQAMPGEGGGQPATLVPGTVWPAPTPTPLPPIPVAADAWNVELVGHIGGGTCTHAVAVQGDYAYIGEGYSLTILDISSPASPSVVGKTSPLPGIVLGIYITSDYAYVAYAAEDEAGLRVLDVSNPSNPTEVGFYETPRSALGVAVAGGYAYAAAGYDGLRVVDVSNPAHPTEVGFYDTCGDAWDVAVAGGYAYVVDDEAGLGVVDVSNPSNPTEVGFYNTRGEAHGVAVSGGYAYVADGEGGLRVVNISTPSNPTEVGACDTPGLALGVAVAGGYAYVADYGGGLRVVDVSNPSNPTEVGFYARNAFGVAVAGDYVYVTDGYDGGLFILRPAVGR